ncbi:MAG: hypothetical protein H0Z24_08900 [Thermosipho sp. (in: Bacteria)]|nr:hypothetical protein [Thermosipho sp. (in: thermotogales)]
MKKLITYVDPFQLRNHYHQEKIFGSPHLCVSQVLVEGLKHQYGRKSFYFINTLEKFIEHFYAEWANPETKIEQYVSLSEQINNITIPSLRRSFKFNQRRIFEAIRYLVELDICPKDIDRSKLTGEQEQFLEIFSKLRHKWPWTALDDKVFHEKRELQKEVRECLKKLINKEIEDGRRREQLGKEEEAYLKSMLAKFSSSECEKELNTVIIHGVHRLTPLILRLANQLDKLDINVLFLIHYLPQYPRIFKTWESVYAEMGLQPVIEDNSTSVLINNDLGRSIGALLEGDISAPLTGRIQFKKFDNLTSFVDYVGVVFDKAKEKVRKGQNPVRVMEEQFYVTDNSLLEGLLMSYYPEQFGEKHFLSYPVGQFILGLYNMWDEDRKTIIINDRSLRECLAVNFFEKEGMPTPLEIYDKVQLFFQDIFQDTGTFEDFIDRLHFLIRVRKQLEKGGYDKRLEGLTGFAFYHVTAAELEYFKDIMEGLESITKKLFKDAASGPVNYGRHLKRLIEIIKERAGDSKTISQKESELIEELSQRFENVDDLAVEGTVEDLKQAIHFYLGVRKEGNEASWIVRNFEQIDGGVLLSRRKEKRDYHLGLLSDRAMKKVPRDLLPWPLDEEFLNACRDKAGNARAVLNSLREYPNFLRYALFYATYFVDNNNIVLSYVENIQGEKEQPYFILDMIGLSAAPSDGTRSSNKKTARHCGLPTGTVDDVAALPRKDIWAFAVCPHRFLLGSVLDGDYYQDEFQCRLLYRALLLRNAWNAYWYEDDVSSWEEAVERENEFLRDYFPFWRPIDFHDIKRWVLNNDQENIRRYGEIPAPDDYYLELRKHFLYGKLRDDYNSDENHLIILFRLRNRQEFKNQINIMENFLNGWGNFSPPPPVVCKYCQHRRVCLQHLREDEA